MDRTITPESIISKYYIPHNSLYNLISYAYRGMEVNTINIYVDLYGIYHNIHSREYRTTITDPLSFTSLIINLCAHYRTFFKKLDIYSKIFLISSFNVPKDSLSIIPYYNRDMVDKLNNRLIGDTIDFNIELLELLCPYLPDIHFIKTEFESSVVMNEIMNRESVDQSLIISTDIYPAQLCTIRPNVSLICPKRTFKGEESSIIPQNTHVEAKETFWRAIIRKISNSLSFERVGSLSPSNMILLGSFYQLKDRCFPITLNIFQSLNLITKTIGFDSIRLTPQSVFDSCKDNPLNEDLKYIIDNRYKTLDIQYQSILFNNSIEYNTLHYENLQDNNAINTINDKYFSKNPIDIFRL